MFDLWSLWPGNSARLGSVPHGLSPKVGRILAISHPDPGDFMSTLNKMGSYW
jgi:hypothetical protein